jgi:hypothetical protein
MKKFLVLFTAVLFVVAACEKESVRPGADDASIAFRSNIESTPVSDGGITPYIIDGANPGGNRTCEEVAAAFGCTFQFSGYKFDCPDGGCPPGTSGSYGPITWSTDGTYVTWSSTIPVKVAFIVKGSNDANVYFYGCGDDDCVSGDFGLASPVNQGGQQSALSNLTICYTPCTPPDDDCNDETAWADGNRYVNRGNWATYTSYSGAAKTVTLFAGQTHNAGTVHFSAPVGGMVTITITLNNAAGWQFNLSDPENVKIQDYAMAPSGNPAPGLFAHKAYATGSPFSIQVPENNFYGVHVDVQQCQ